MFVPFVNTPEFIPSCFPSIVTLITLPSTTASTISSPSPYNKLTFVNSTASTFSGNSISYTEFPYISDVSFALFTLISTSLFSSTVDKLSLSITIFASVAVSTNFSFVSTSPSSVIPST